MVCPVTGITLVHVRRWVKLLFFSPRITAYFTAGILKAASRQVCYACYLNIFDLLYSWQHPSFYH